VIGILVLAALAMILFAAHRAKPELFRLDAGFARWVWLKIEWRSPRQDARRKRRPNGS